MAYTGILKTGSANGEKVAASEDITQRYNDKNIPQHDLPEKRLVFLPLFNQHVYIPLSEVRFLSIAMKTREYKTKFMES